MIRTAVKNGFHRFEWIHRKASGEDFPVEVSLTPISYRGKNILHCLWRDLTEAKRTTDALRAIASEGQGVMVVLSAPRDSDALLARLRREPEVRPAGKDKDVGQWRRNGAGAQILADLGLGRLRVLGTPRRQIGLAGYGLEIVETLQP